jgi:hypothetical protein
MTYATSQAGKTLQRLHSQHEAREKIFAFNLYLRKKAKKPSFVQALARRGVQARQRELTACHQIIEAHVAALTEKLHTEEAQSPWRSAPRQLSTTILIPQPT